MEVHMSAKTKIVVLHMKRIVFTGIVIGLILIFAVCLMLFLKPKDNSMYETVPTMYTPGVYTSSVQLGDAALDIQVAVDENHINSISLVNLDETMETMYPLVRPALDELSEQITANQSMDDITYSQNNQYTSIVLLSAIEEALEKAASE